MEIAIIAIIFPMLKLLVSEYNQDNLRGYVFAMIFLCLLTLEAYKLSGDSEMITRFYPFIMLINIPVLIRIYNLYKETRQNS